MVINLKHYLCFAEVLDEGDDHRDHNWEFFQKMVVEHGEVDKFLEQEENVTEQLTDPNQVNHDHCADHWIWQIVTEQLTDPNQVKGVFDDHC